MKEECLCIFTRYPEPGKTKTRLIPAIGPEGAASLQQMMTTRLLVAAAHIKEKQGIRLEVRFEGGDRKRMKEAFGEAFVYRPQGNGDLGSRMRRCVRDNINSLSKRIVIVGSDVPGINARILSKAFKELQDNDLVIGPAVDGGYYLIGLKRDVPELFKDILWGKDDVFSKTVDIANGLGLTVYTLPTLADIDRFEDLVVLEQSWGREMVSKTIGRVSVIIPTLNEASRISGLVETLKGIDPTLEIIVVDGGSADGTEQKASACGAKILTTEPGRAKQMNAGAQAATSDILLFLHADTSLPQEFPSLVRATLGNPEVAAGAFQFQIDAEGWAYRLLERLVNWRSRILQMPYGDQAIFMRANKFSELGGFCDMPIMEDFEMVRRLRRYGRIAIIPAPAVTSARRWQKRGFLRTTLLHQWLIGAYCIGISPRRLAAHHKRNG